MHHLRAKRFFGWVPWSWLCLVLWTTAVCALAFTSPLRAGADRADEVRFEIKSFEIDGNTIFSDEKLMPLLEDFVGAEKSAGDVESARAQLEKFHHQNGYPTILVNIPEQSVASGTIRLEVIESTIRRVRVTGNRYYTMKKILSMTTSLKPGTVLYLPDLQADLVRLNQHPDLKVAPTLSPGRELGTIDVELKVVDKLPLHGSLELNNRNSHNTPDLRINGMIKYDNLWQRDHSASLQFQTAPEDTESLQAMSGSYVLAPFWNDEHILAIYGIYSNSDTAFGEGFQTQGKGYIVGLRNVIPLQGGANFYQNVTLGLDYKNFDEVLGFGTGGGEDIVTPISYLPLSLAYGAVQRDRSGGTDITLGLNLLPRGIVVDREDFEDKRFKTRANYSYLTLTLNRTQHLGAGWDALVRLEGQLSDQSLVSNEQYYAGGMNSVHGYKESEVGGDNALYARFDLATPDLWDALSSWKLLDLKLHAYYDYAGLWLLDPLPLEDASATLQGVGAGLTGALGRYLDFEVHWGMALEDTARTEADHQEIYFAIKGKF